MTITVLAAQYPDARPVRARSACKCALQERRTVRGHPRPHGARAGRGRAQILRPRNRRIPGGESRDGRDGAAC